MQVPVLPPVPVLALLPVLESELKLELVLVRLLGVPMPVLVVLPAVPVLLLVSMPVLVPLPELAPRPGVWAVEKLPLACCWPRQQGDGRGRLCAPTRPAATPLKVRPRRSTVASGAALHRVTRSVCRWGRSSKLQEWYSLQAAAAAEIT